MNALERLEHIKKIDQLIDAKIAERDRLIALATDISAKPITDMPYHGKGLISRKVEDAVVELVSLSGEIDRLIDYYVDYKRQMVMILEQLPVNEYGVLHRHYIRYMTCEAIAEDMGYSVQHIYRLKKKGLQDLALIIPETHS